MFEQSIHLPHTHTHILQSPPREVRAALCQKDDVLPMDLLPSRASSAWPLSQEKGCFSQEQSWRGTRPLCACSSPFLPLLSQADGQALPQSPQLRSTPQPRTALPTISAHALQLRRQARACHPATVCKDAKLSKRLSASKHEHNKHTMLKT